jgi:hypothetical protein
MSLADARSIDHLDDRGSALLIALVATTMLSALGLGLAILSTTESGIAGNYRLGSETAYAAEAAIERVMSDILRVRDWNLILGGQVQSSFISGATTPILPSGQQVDLLAMTTELQAASDATLRRGANNPRWRLFAYGPLRAMAAPPLPSHSYVIVWIADDPNEVDDDPLVDGNGVLIARARALGIAQAARAVEVTLTRAGLSDERGLVAQQGQAAANQHARGTVVFPRGRALASFALNVATGGWVPR